jgi:glycosyltransferase involved in cell wall biosynthesis
MILAAARHYHLKGLDVLVRAFPDVAAAFPDAVLVVAGREGPATPELRRLAAEGRVEGRSRFLGYRSDVADLMAAADVFALPSRAEGSPGALIESMALEVPTVASDIPSVREIAGTPPRTAALFPVGAAPAMARRIIGLLDDPASAAELAAAGRRRFLDGYTLDAIADATIDLYLSVLPGRSGRSGG